MENKQCSVFIETAWQFSIIHYQFSKFHNLFLTQRQFLHSFCCYNPRVFDTDGTNAWQNNLRFQSKDHARFQLLLHAWSQHRHFIDFQSDAMTDKLGFLSGSHKVVGKARFGDNIDSEIVKVLTNSTRFRFFYNSLLYVQANLMGNICLSGSFPIENTRLMSPI